MNNAQPQGVLGTLLEQQEREALAHRRAWDDAVMSGDLRTADALAPKLSQRYSAHLHSVPGPDHGALNRLAQLRMVTARRAALGKNPVSDMRAVVSNNPQLFPLEHPSNINNMDDVRHVLAEAQYGLQRVRNHTGQ